MGRNSSRGGGRGGRGGRGGGRGRRHGKGSKPTPKGPELKFALPTVDARNRAAYATVFEDLVRSIHRQFGQDVAQSIRELKRIDTSGDKPTQQVSTMKDDMAKAVEQDAFNIMCGEEMRIYLERDRQLTAGIQKSCAEVLQKHCTTGMRTKVLQQQDHESKIQDNAFELLKAVKQLTTDPVRARYR